MIGAGWIGAEVAASARQKGLEVEIVERAKVPLEHVLGTEVGEIYADDPPRSRRRPAHRARRSRPSRGTVGSSGSGSADGRTIDCDLVVVGVGVAPRVALAEAAGIEVENGILTDERLETSVPGVFAAGDVANAFHPFYGRPAAGRALGQRAQARRDRRPDDARQARRRRPFALLLLRPVRRRDGVFGVRDASGTRSSSAAIPPVREFIAFWLSGGRVVAGMNVNVWDVADPIAELIRSRASRSRRRSFATPSPARRPARAAA